MYNRILKPLLFRLDAERAHNLVTALMSVTAHTPAPAFFDALRAQDDPILATDVAGLCLSNPIGLAAGFDKRAVAIEPIAMLGFGKVGAGKGKRGRQPGNR